MSGKNSANYRPLVAGTVAHDGVDSGNPVKIGGRARSGAATKVADGDRVDATFDLLQRLIIIIGQPRDQRSDTRVVLTGTTETTVLAAGGSGVMLDVAEIVIANDSTTDLRVDIRDDTAGTIRDSFAIKAGTTGGVSRIRAKPQAVANKPWTATLSATPSGGNAQVIVTMSADKNA